MKKNGCECTVPGFCKLRNRVVRWVDIQTCRPRATDDVKSKNDILQCRCPGPGMCPTYGRYMNPDDYAQCSRSPYRDKLRMMSIWLQDKIGVTGRKCVFDNGPATDENGVRVWKKSCRCLAEESPVAMRTCLHPLHSNIVPEGCETNCRHFVEAKSDET